jgi:FkbM family methyltransferase
LSTIRKFLARILGSAVDVDDSLFAEDFARMKRMLHTRSPHEDDFHFFRNCPAEAGPIMDVGANLGQSAVSFRCVCPDRAIESFEPNALLEPGLKYVKQHLLNNFTYHMVGLSNGAADMKLFVPYVDGKPYFEESSIERDQFDKPWVRERLQSYGSAVSFKEIIVPLVTADSFRLSPSIVKIDAEGHELSVLEGMKETILRSRPVFMIENNDYHRVTPLLAQHGYEAFSYDAKENHLRPVCAVTNSFYLHNVQHRQLIKDLYLPITGAGTDEHVSAG